MLAPRSCRDTGTMCLGDQGEEGLEQFKKQHKCNRICLAIGLDPLTDAASASHAFNEIIEGEEPEQGTLASTTGAKGTKKQPAKKKAKRTTRAATEQPRATVAEEILPRTILSTGRAVYAPRR